MKNTLAQVPYKCSCGSVTRHYVWSDDIKKTKVKCSCGKVLNMGNIERIVINAPAIRTPTKNR